MKSFTTIISEANAVYTKKVEKLFKDAGLDKTARGWKFKGGVTIRSKTDVVRAIGKLLNIDKVEVIKNAAVGDVYKFGDFRVIFPKSSVGHVRLNN